MSKYIDFFSSIFCSEFFLNLTSTLIASLLSFVIAIWYWDKQQAKISKANVATEALIELTDFHFKIRESFKLLEMHLLTVEDSKGLETHEYRYFNNTLQFCNGEECASTIGSIKAKLVIVGGTASQTTDDYFAQIKVLESSVRHGWRTLRTEPAKLYSNVVEEDRKVQLKYLEIRDSLAKIANFS